jgi:hypothetical protein
MVLESLAGIAAGVAAYVLVGPFLTLAHELGHALVGVALTDEEVNAVVGGNAGVEAVGERLRVVFHPAAFRTPWYGVCWFDGDVTLPARTQVAFSLAGPAVTAALAVGLFAAVPLVDWWVVRAGLVGLLSSQVVVLAVTLFPVRYPSWWGGYAGLESDGLQAWRALRGRSDDD